MFAVHSTDGPSLSGSFRLRLSRGGLSCFGVRDKAGLSWPGIRLAVHGNAGITLTGSELLSQW